MKKNNNSIFFKCMMLIFVVCFLFLFAACNEKGAAIPRPNILFVLTDDQRSDTIGITGNPFTRTPNLDALANQGVLFKNAYITTSICAPSRASIMSGQYVMRHGINGFKEDFSPPALAQTYPILLGKAGYRIGFIGKYGIGSNPPAGQFDYWKGFAGQGHYMQKDEHGRYKHLTQLIEEQAIEFLQGCSKKQPFCLSISFKAPHSQDGHPDQFLYDRRYEQLYKDVTIPPSETADNMFWEAFPDFFRKNNEGRKRWEIRFSTPAKYQEMVKGYYRLITGVDRAVGNIRKELRRLDLAGNTIIIFTSDNGFFLGEHGLAGKWYGYEESIRVPLIVYDPRLKAGQRGHVRQEIALNIDIAPTILSLADLPVPARMQGRDLTLLVKGEDISWRKDFFYEHRFDYITIPQSEGVIGKRYKYLRYLNQDPVYEELYDLKTDPNEVNNLAGDSRYKDILQNMRKRYEELRQTIK